MTNLAIQRVRAGHARQHGFARVVLSPSERSVPFYQRAGFAPAATLLVWTP